MTTISQNIVDTLAANGVERVYGIPGDSLNGFTDSIRTSKIRWVLTRHEEAAAFAAAADAAVSGKLAVCVGSCGPGNLHLINGLFDAQRSRVPVLAIAAHIPTSEIGSGYFQETHPQELFRECSVYAEHVSNPSQMPRMLRVAIQNALERRGVAVLVIPGDIGLATAEDTTVTVVHHTQPHIVPSDEELTKAADLLNAGKQITILAGAGVEGAHDQVVALADRLAAPIVHAMRGKEMIEWDNPFDVGMTGLLGFASGYRAMDAADTLLMLGTDFPYPQFYPEGAVKIQVDIRGENLGRRTPLDLGLVGDVADTATALMERLEQKSDRSHLEASTDHYAKTRQRLDDLAGPSREGRPIHPQYVARLIDEIAAEDAVFIPDVGTPVVWAARYLHMNGKRRLIGSFTHGSMANALPQAVGAQVAAPGRQVVSLSGDGGLAMLMGELLTLRQNELPVKVIIFNNSALSFVELEMKAAGFVNYGTELSNPNFAAIGAAMGIHSARVERSADVEAALRDAFALQGPALVDVVIDRQELSMPPSITAQQMKGFTIYALRTVLSGRGDELVELARTNLRRKH